jgi:hypothetical protein
LSSQLRRYGASDWRYLVTKLLRENFGGRETGKGSSDQRILAEKITLSLQQKKGSITGSGAYPCLEAIGNSQSDHFLIPFKKWPPSEFIILWLVSLALGNGGTSKTDAFEWNAFIILSGEFSTIGLGE